LTMAYSMDSTSVVLTAYEMIVVMTPISEAWLS